MINIQITHSWNYSSYRNVRPLIQKTNTLNRIIDLRARFHSKNNSKGLYAALNVHTSENPTLYDRKENFNLRQNMYFTFQFIWIKAAPWIIISNQDAEAWILLQSWTLLPLSGIFYNIHCFKRKKFPKVLFCNKLIALLLFI